jgi:hypothetical protein
MSEDAIDQGRSEYRKLLQQIADAKESEEWPGYEPPDEWNLPAWAMDDEGVELVISGQKVRM